MDKRAFGVIPNYRTADASLPYEPISASHKLVIGLKDSFDGPTFPVAAVFATIHQAENDNPSFGQGMAGWARRFGTAIGDQVICNMMTESFMPMLLRQDPRYFRIGKGTSAWHRAAYALTRIFVTLNDSGKRSFNYSEIVGTPSGRLSPTPIIRTAATSPITWKGWAYNVSRMGFRKWQKNSGPT